VASAKTPCRYCGMAQKFADANIGVVCGLSGIVIVDVDKPELVAEILERFGDTPLMTRTPSGGVHLWYRKLGPVRSGNLRRQNLDVDIKADGGLVVTPSSRNPKGVYAFERGTWDDVQRRPPFRQEALAAPPSNDNNESAAAPIAEGDRNNALHRRLLRIAPHLESFDAFLAEASRFNNEVLRPPLSAAEVEKTARGAWRYQTEGRNWVGSQGHVTWAVELVQMCAPHKHGGDAVILMTVLRAKHAQRETFPVAAARWPSIKSWRGGASTARGPRWRPRWTSTSSSACTRAAVSQVIPLSTGCPRTCEISHEYNYYTPSPLTPHVSKTC
jgi:Bifunctional DNA primase/polymerase, N-terminal/Primase C terminal 1 (PriCT-1)